MPATGTSKKGPRCKLVGWAGNRVAQRSETRCSWRGKQGLDHQKTPVVNLRGLNFITKDTGNC